MNSDQRGRFYGVVQCVLVVGIVGAAVAFSAALKPSSPPSRAVSAPQPVTVSVVEPQSSPFSPVVRLNGVVRARTVADVISQVAGRVVDVAPAFRPGGVITSGDVLFKIDPADYRLDVERTYAEIEGARSDLTRLEAEAAAERAVWESRHPDRPIPDLIARIPQIAAAKARIRSGEAARKLAELALGRTVVRAPFDARVLETRLGVGQVVGGNAAVGTIFSIASLEIETPVSAKELARIGPPDGRVARIVAEFDESPTLSGRVVRTGAALDERTRLGTLFIAGEDVAGLTVGEFVTVDIEGATIDSAYRLAPAALTSRDQLWVVDNGRLAERRVDVLAFEDETVVVGAFDAADGVVTVAPSDARAGLTVEADSPGRLAATGDQSRAAP